MISASSTPTAENENKGITSESIADPQQSTASAIGSKAVTTPTEGRCIHNKTNHCTNLP